MQIEGLKAMVVGDATRMDRPDECGRLAVAIIENPMINGGCIRLDAGQRFAPK